MYGWSDKKQLVSWNGNDANLLYKVKWLENYRIPDFNNKDDKEAYYMNLFKELSRSLPQKELDIMLKALSKINIKKDKSRFHTILRCTIIDIQQKLSVHSSYKENLLNGIDINEKKEMTFKEYRESELKRNSGYLSYDVLKYVPPIEILEYIGFKLIKYDMLRNNYYIVLQYPDNLKNEPIVLHDKDAIALESKGENLFETEIDKYLKANKNPYGDKSFINVDISNIENIMNSNGNDPLDIDDIF